ncbi:MAG: hypothetical protein COV47_05790 [Candidatus Diapherotrites archaeon CG11_big_fil_rev_8_21_14_0_20_37_9]|nr:MAG: hypothetical protein COV47_05790 [Candidatus Diapherotrites archaeon CG11_big_fil_rev_8_21_14_0_20_37_9]
MFGLKNIVAKQYNSKNIGLGIIFFLLPLLITLALKLFLSSFNPLDFVITAVKEGLFWIISSLLLFVLFFAFKGKDVSGKFMNIFSAFSVTFLVQFIFSILAGILMLILLPGFVSVALNKNVPVDTDSVSSALASSGVPTGIGLTITLLVFVFIFLAAVVAMLYIILQISQSVRKTTMFSNLVLLVVFIALSIFLRAILDFGFTLFA